jgi:hypothetical protein
MSGETFSVYGYASRTIHDFEPTLGKEWIYDVSAKDGNGNTIDITSPVAIKWRVSASMSSTSPIFTRSVGTGIAVVNGTAGTLRITTTPAIQSSGTIAAGTRYRHECELITSGSVTYQLVAGYITPAPGLSG